MNICGIFVEEAESMDHLMVGCSFTKQVWREVLNNFNISQDWEDGSLVIFFERFIKGAHVWKEFPCFVFWEVWKLRNKVLFESMLKYVQKVSNREIYHFKEFHLENDGARMGNIGPPPTSTYEVTSFFEGALQISGGLHGVGGHT